MISKTIGKTNLLLILALVFFSMALYFQVHSKKPVIVISSQESALNLNQNFIKFLSLGNRRLISDVIWIQTLLEADMERYTGQDLGNWLYLRFLTISELDPKFYENYQYGGIFLSIIKDDLEGAADLYERGLKIFPSDYKLNYQAGFNYYFEMGDYENGLRLLKKVEHHPDANQMIKFLISKLQFESDRNFDLTIAFLKLTLESTKNPTIEEKLKADIYALTAERDLECLNSNAKQCSRTDTDGKPYQFTNGQWIAGKVFLPYRIYRRSFQREKKK